MGTLAVLGARFMAALTMMRVARISLSSRGSTPCLASGAAYATPFGATISLHMPRLSTQCFIANSDSKHLLTHLLQSIDRQ